jgi:HlyD family secretion protein
MRIALRFCLLGLIVALGSIAGCSRKPAEPEGGKGKGAAPSFGTVKPERQTLERVIEQPAHVEAYEETPLVVRIPGYVGKIDCDIGTKLQKGQVLAELHVPEMHVELKQKDELVKQAEAELTLAKESVKAAEAEEDRLKGQYDRFAKIPPGGALDKETLEETRLGYLVSKAKHGMAKAEVGVKKARVGVAEQNRDYVKTMLEYAELRAPYDCIVTQRNVHTGRYLQPGAGNSPPFVVAQSEKVRVVSKIPEPEAAYVQEKMPATIRVQMLKDRQFSGTVTRTSWSLDAKERTLRVEIELPSDSLLLPGAYAYVTLKGTFPERLTVPASAVVTQGEQSCLFLLQDGKAFRTPVHLGLRSGKLVELLRKQVVREGKTSWEPCTGEETVLTGDLAALTDGQAVTVSTR